MADFIGSTSALLKYVDRVPDAGSSSWRPSPESSTKWRRRRPEKTFIPAPPNGNCACNECPFMRLNTLEKLYLALRDLSPVIEMTEELRLAALRPIERMLELLLFQKRAAGCAPEPKPNQP